MDHLRLFSPICGGCLSYRALSSFIPITSAHCIATEMSNDTNRRVCPILHAAVILYVAFHVSPAPVGCYFSWHFRVLGKSILISNCPLCIC